MPKPSTISIAEKDFNEISLYYRSGESAKLSPAQTEILNRWQSAYGILRQYPTKHVAMKKLQLLYPGLSRSQAFADVDNAIRFWNKTSPVDRDFIESWFIETLLTEIAEERDRKLEINENGEVVSAPNLAAIAKNLATLQKYIATLPPVKIDPKHIEKNNIYIQFNLNGNMVNFTEEEIMRLPQSIRQRFLESIPTEITDTEAAEIINS
ncbi:MAG: hypothetical protein PHR53_02425 [Bacteroidales bacterium]|nr:hypothetical protein [Bacteroidales bacterium]